jgi:hypothetical protein
MRTSKTSSGTRDSNPRHPAWEAETVSENVENFPDWYHTGLDRSSGFLAPGNRPCLGNCLGEPEPGQEPSGPGSSAHATRAESPETQPSTSPVEASERANADPAAARRDSQERLAPFPLERAVAVLQYLRLRALGEVE